MGLDEVVEGVGVEDGGQERGTGLRKDGEERVVVSEFVRGGG